MGRIGTVLFALLFLAVLSAFAGVQDAPDGWGVTASEGQTIFADVVESGGPNLSMSLPSVLPCDTRLRSCDSKEKQNCVDGCLLRNPGGAVLMRDLTECGWFQPEAGAPYKSCTCFWLAGDAKYLVP